MEAWRKADTMEPELLTVREAASLLRLSRSHTYDLIREGALPVVYLGRSVRVPRRALIAWIERQTQTQTQTQTEGEGRRP